ncbi:MAG: YfhO family protein, partial [Ruminococcus sp.]
GNKNYKEQCAKLASSSCSSFEYTSNGFKAEYNNRSGDNLLFFSIPYSKGFSAKVNGNDVEIEKVNYGFMAVKVPGYTDCEIEFTYETPGLSAGIKISLAALFAFAVYVAFIIIYRKRKRKTIIQR